MSQPNENRSTTTEVLIGVALSLVMLPIALLSIFGMMALSAMEHMFTPLNSRWWIWLWMLAPQVAYLACAIIIARRRNRTGIVIGVIIGGSLIFLLISACVGLLVNL